MYKKSCGKLQLKYEHMKQQDLKISKSRKKMKSCWKKRQILSCSQSLSLESKPKYKYVKGEEE